MGGPGVLHADGAVSWRGYAGGADGQVSFGVVGSAGNVYRVLWSTNLHDLQPIASITNLSGTTQFTDPGAAGYSRRFYRLVMP